MLVSAAHGSWTWIRPSAANGVSTIEPFVPSSYVPCWKKTMAWMQLGFELFELKRYWASSKKPSSVLEGRRVVGRARSAWGWFVT